jgi:hypothetical protein
MHVDEARELRATLEEALNPLYAARTGTIPAMQGVTAAIAVIQRIDKALLGVLQRDEAGRQGEALAAAYVEERAAVAAHIAREE